MVSPSDDRWVAADAYEAYMGRWSRPLARAFLTWLRPPPAAHWLEVGCGTGALTSAICQLANPATVTACDPSEAFVAHARSALDDPRVTFLVGGSDSLPERDGGFDMIALGLVLNFLPDPERAIASFRERVRPGGSVAAYVWDYAEGMAFLRRFWDAAVAADPRAAAFDEGRRFRLGNRPALEELFRASGLRQVESGPLVVATEFTDFDDYWSPLLRGTGTAPAYVASLDAPARDALRERVRAALPSADDGRIRLRARAWAVRGEAA